MSSKKNYWIKAIYRTSVIALLFINTNSFSQTISSTGSGTSPCGDCTPTGWIDSNGTPDISNRYNAGGQGSTGGQATWAAGTLPLPPTGDLTWVTLRDVGPNYSEESISTQMGSLISGKIYKLTVHTMTTLSNSNGGGSSPGSGSVYYAGTLMDQFDYEINSNGRQTISTITTNEWGETVFYFLGNPDGSGEMTLKLFPQNNAPFANNGDTVDLEMIHIAVELNALELLDSDNDGIDDSIDIDDDNDGITDLVESGGNNPNGDHDGDQLPNYLDSDHPYDFDTDNDGIANHLDLDSDNDGIPDNIEAQSTTGYVAPSGSESGITDTNNNGLDDSYESSPGVGLTPQNTDSSMSNSDAIADYLDSDSDGDGVSDTIEANLTISGTVGSNGLYSVFDNGDSYADVNGFYDTTQTDNFIDADNDVNTTGDVDYRDQDQTGSEIDTDLDGIPNSIDIDDDNDGILDVDEGGGSCSSTVLTTTTQILGDGPASATQNVNLTSLNLTIGDIVQVNNVLARGDLDQTNNSETFTLTFNNSITTAALKTGNACASSLETLTAPISQLVTVIDIGSGVPGIIIQANTLVGVDNYCSGIGGLEYTVDIQCNTATAIDTDNDGIKNYLDLDSDNDGIPDNIEAQSTLGYIAPSGSGSGIIDTNNNGLDDSYESSPGVGLAAVNTDSSNDAIPDYLDTDSDNDGTLDRTEANLSLSGTVGINGLDSNIDNGDNYADVNGNFDTTQFNNFPDNDADVNSGGDVDYRDTDSAFQDNDDDGIIDSIDLDDDNDGALDTVESGIYDAEGDEDGDGILNYKDTSDGGGSGDSSTTSYVDLNSDGIADVYDFDNDGIPNHFDLDSDNDGIPDNIEIQTTTGYIAPTSTFGATGIDLAYGSGLTPVNTDGTDNPDYFDLDADNDGITDNTEANIVLTGTVGNNGLDNSYDNGDNYADVNGNFDISQTDNFPDEDADVNSGGDVDYRDDTFTFDNDDDNVNDEIDLDDDNDGIIDTLEYGTCTPNSAIFNWASEYTESSNQNQAQGDDPIATDPTKTINSVGVTLHRTSNVSSDSNYRINDLISNNNYQYTLAQKARQNAESSHTFIFDSPVYGLNFILYDLDIDTNTTSIDQVQILLTKEDGTTYTIQGSDYTISSSSSTYSGGIFTGNNTNNGNVTINSIPAWIIKLRIVYKNSGTGSINGNQRIGIGNLSFCTPIDTDGDTIFNYKDLDSDNDGIPDNIEAQSTSGYIAPTNTYSIFGIDLAYGNGVTPENTDQSAPANSDTIPDYLDLDSDGDGDFDINESGSGLTDGNNDGKTDGAVGTNGLDNTLDNGDNYSDVNGNFDNSITDNFTDTDGDVNTPNGDLDYRDISNGIDTDSDGITDLTDIDDDNDGIVDTLENGIYDAEGDEDGDGILNYKDTSDAGNSGDNSTTNYTDSNSDGIPDVFDFDNDGFPNHLDIDADNDGIPDNIEAQPTVGYIAPSGIENNITDDNNNGLDDNYETSQGGTNIITPVNTDSTNDAIPDYLDLDSDNDGTPDIEENGDSDNVASGTDSDNDGLDDNFEGNNATDGFDVNDEINTPSANLPDTDSDVNTTGDVDYRDDNDDVVVPSVVGNTLWLRADIGTTGGTNVSFWEDQTASNADFGGLINRMPNATTNTLNFNPTVTFTEGNNDVMAYTGNLNPRSMYIVYNDISTGSWKSPFTNNDGDGIGHGNNNDSQVFDTTYNPADVRNGSQFVNGLATTLTNHPRPDNFELHSRIFLSNLSNGNHTYTVGSDRGNSGRTINGSVAEVILFSTVHSAAQRQQIESYLGIKYGFTLSNTNNDGAIIEGDYVLSDLSTKIWNYTNNSSYHNDVAGIGRDDGMVLKQRQSKSVNSDALITIGLGAISNTNALNSNNFTSNKDFLVWGNNNGSLSTTSTATLICAPEKTLNRTWKIVENGSVGSVQIAIDKGTVDGLLNTGYTAKVLKIADDANFTTNVQYAPITSATVNGTAQYVTNYNFNGTKYFTYAEINGIFWGGDSNAWLGGSAADNSASTELADVDKVMVIDSQISQNHAILNQDARVECVWIKENSRLTVADGKFLELDEDFILDGELRMVGDAQLIQTHIGLTNVQGTGKIYIDQKATVPNVYRYHYWSSPVVEVGKSTFTVGGVMKDGSIPTSANALPNEARDINFTPPSVSLDGAYDPTNTNPITIASRWIYTYKNGTDGNSWIQKLNTGTINRGEGYTMKSTGRTPQNFTFVGTPNDGTINIPLIVDTNSLIGNPYPSALDAIDFINDNLNVVNGTIYFWEHTGEDASSTLTEGHNIAGYQGGYSTRNLALGIAAQAPTTGTSGLGGGSYNTPGRYVAVGQSFYVGAHSSGNLTFENSHRNHQANDGSNSIFLKGGKKKASKSQSTNPTPASEITYLKVGFEYTNDANVDIHRQIGVSFNKDLTFAFDPGYDSYAFDVQPTDVYWKFPWEDSKYTIIGVQDITNDLEIPINIAIESTRQVKFQLDETQHFNGTVYLFDKITGITHQLSDQTPLLLTLITGTYTDRFAITFKEQQATLGTDLDKGKSLKVYFDGASKSLKILNPDALTISEFELISVSGKVLKQSKFTENPEKISLSNISQGVYIVKLQTSSGKLTQKIAIY